MKKIIQATVCAMVLSVASLPVALAAPTFAQVVDGVDGNKNTKAAASENWKKFKGQEVSWSGVVHDVSPKRRGGAVIYAADKSRPLYKGYNLKLETADLEKASNLKKGQAIRFKGVIDGFSSKNPGAVIELEGVTF